MNHCTLAQTQAPVLSNCNPFAHSLHAPLFHATHLVTSHEGFSTFRHLSSTASYSAGHYSHFLRSSLNFLQFASYAAHLLSALK